MFCRHPKGFGAVQWLIVLDCSSNFGSVAVARLYTVVFLYVHVRTAASARQQCMRVYNGRVPRGEYGSVGLELDPRT
jgi:hypothetical protein